MQDIVINFLKEKGVSEDIISKITPSLEGVTNTDQLKSVLEKFADQLPVGIMDNLPALPDAGGFLNKAKKMISGIFGK